MKNLKIIFLILTLISLTVGFSAASNMPAKIVIPSYLFFLNPAVFTPRFILFAPALGIAIVNSLFGIALNLSKSRQNPRKQRLIFFVFLFLALSLLFGQGLFVLYITV